MNAVLERSADKARTEAKVSERKCLVSGELKNRADLIRFVIGPDRRVIPDLAENLPGHGMWVSANRADITAAAKKNLFAKAAKTAAKPDAELADLVARLLRARCLSLLGLAKGAGVTILGEGQAEAALRARKAAFYLAASDAAKLLENRHDIPVCRAFSRDELGNALGYAQIVHAALLPHKLTEKLRLEIGRLANLEAEPPRALTSSEGNEGIV
jgi:predicted RNA-binding protein YlxR (DUF448 family)